MPTLRLQLHHTFPSTRALYGVDQRVARHGQIKVHLESRTRTKGVGSAIVRDLSARLVRHALHRCALQRRDAAFRLGIIVRVAASSPLDLRSQFGGLHVRGEQPRKARGIAARHAAFGRDAVDPGMAPGGGEASRVAGHVIAVHEAEI